MCRVYGILAVFLLATALAAAVRPAAAAGLAGNALEFDGLDDFVNVLDAPSLSLQTLTLEAWVLP